MSLTNHHITSHNTGVSNPRTCTGAELFQLSIHPHDFMCMFISNGLTSQNLHLRDPLKVWNSRGYRFTGPCHYIPYLVEDRPLCWHRIRATCVIVDNLAHFNFIMIMCNFFWFDFHYWWFLIVGLLATCHGSWKISTWLFAQGFHEVWRDGENL